MDKGKDIMKFLPILFLVLLSGCATMTDDQRMAFQQFGRALQEVGQNMQMNQMQMQIYRNQCLACR